MWQLVDVDSGRVCAKYLTSPWDVCKNAFKADGKRYKKAEALLLKPGQVIYVPRKSKRFFKLPVFQGNTLAGEETRTTDVKTLAPCRLELMP